MSVRPIDHETFRYPSEIASPTVGVRLIDDTCAPITTRKLWSNGNSVKSAPLSLARSREITSSLSSTGSNKIDERPEKEDNFTKIRWRRDSVTFYGGARGIDETIKLKGSVV